MAAMRDSGFGWVLSQSGVPPLPKRIIFSHRVTAAFGLKPALAASSMPTWSASLSASRLLGSCRPSVATESAMEARLPRLTPNMAPASTPAVSPAFCICARDSFSAW